MPYAHLQARVYKYDLPSRKEGVVTLPKGSKLLSVGVQMEDLPEDATSRQHRNSIERGTPGKVSKPVMWAEVYPSDSADDDVPLAVYMVATGAPLPRKPMTYVGSVQLPAKSGVAVFHVYVDSQAPVTLNR